MAIAQETHVIFAGSTLLLMAISPFHPQVGGLMVLVTRTIFMQDIGRDVCVFSQKIHGKTMWIPSISHGFSKYFNMKSWTSRPSFEVRHASPPQYRSCEGIPFQAHPLQSPPWESSPAVETRMGVQKCEFSHGNYHL